MHAYTRESLTVTVTVETGENKPRSEASICYMDHSRQCLGVRLACATYPLVPRRTILSSSPTRVLIHLTPCSWGSIIRGHLSALVRIVAFSMDMRSLGKFSLFHRAIVAASVSRDSTSSFSVMVMGGWGVHGCGQNRMYVALGFREFSHVSCMYVKIQL